MSDDKQQTTARNKAGAHCALQMDDSTDVAGHAILFACAGRGRAGAISPHGSSSHHHGFGVPKQEYVRQNQT